MKTLLNKYAISGLLSLLFLVLFSCSDADKTEDPAPVNSALITITSPIENDMNMMQDSVHITGSISAQQTLHGYTISIRKKSDNTEVYKKDFHDHKTNITIDQKWGITGLQGHTDLVLEIITSLDHDGNTASKKVNFHIMP